MKLNRGISILMQTGKKVKILLNKSYIFQFSLLVKMLYSYVKHTERKKSLTVKNNYLPLLFVMDLPGARGCQCTPAAIPYDYKEYVSQK